MSISRPSDPRTVLLWGKQWWLAGCETPVVFDDLGHAAEVLADHFQDEPKPMRLRLIFQPDTMRTVSTPCPLGNRSMLAAALSPEFPALGRPDCAWGHEPILSLGETHSTLLHFEDEPGLFDLAGRLAHLGLAVVSAWPLATFLHALPDEWTDTGAMTVVCLHPTQALAHRHPANGGPNVHLWTGDSSIVEVSQWLGAILGENPSEPVLVVCADHQTAANLEAFLGVQDHPGLEVVQLAAALRQQAILARYHPAQLLPPPPVVTAHRALLAASIALFLGTAGLGGLAIHSKFTARNEQRAEQVRVATLRLEVGRLKENAAAISALRSLVAAGAGGPPYMELLAKIGRTIPQEIVLDRLRLSGCQIGIDGWVTPSAGQATVTKWQTALSAGSERWTLDAKLNAGGSVTASGTFRP